MKLSSRIRLIQWIALIGLTVFLGACAQKRVVYTQHCFDTLRHPTVVDQKRCLDRARAYGRQPASVSEESRTLDPQRLQKMRTPVK